ncbi:hypothetical protein JCM3765_001683 [Sporobolomyces pararoseus]
MAPPLSALPLTDLDDPLDFTFPPLQSLDSSLRCQICHELFTAPVILATCSHTFDSLCLRNHLREIKKCPQCSLEANEDRIRRNLIVEELVNNWKKSRSHLISLETTASTAPSPTPVPSTSRSTLPPPTTASSSSSSSISTRQSSKRKLAQPQSPPTGTASRKKIKSEAPSTQQQRTGGGAESITIDEDASSDIEVIEDYGITSTSSSRKRPKREGVTTTNQTSRNRRESKGKERMNDQDQDQDSANLKDPSILVTCPLCSKLVKNGSMSAHVDSNCVNFVVKSSSTGKGKGPKTEDAFGKMMGMSQFSNNGHSGLDDSPSNPSASSSTNSSIPQDTTKYLALPNYAHKKLKEIEQLLKSLGLPVTVPSSHSKSPDQKISYLKKRHSQFLTLWNANADIDPVGGGHKSVKELRDELRRWEKVLLEEEKELATAAGASGKGKLRNGGIGNGETYTKTHENDFKNLIALARASHLRDKAKREQKKQQEEQTKPEERLKDLAEGGNGPVEGGARSKEEAVETEKQNPAEPEKVSEEEVLGAQSNAEEAERTEKEAKNEMEIDGPEQQDPAPLPISPPLQEAVELSENLNTSKEASSYPTPTLTKAPTARRTVRILTPPPVPSPQPSSSPLSSPPADQVTTPPRVDGADEAAEDEDGRAQRSSSILEYDEKFFPPTSQRVREVDWEMIRKAREEEEAEYAAEEEEEEEERNDQK